MGVEGGRQERTRPHGHIYEHLIRKEGVRKEGVLVCKMMLFVISHTANMLHYPYKKGKRGHSRPSFNACCAT